VYDSVTSAAVFCSGCAASAPVIRLSSEHRWGILWPDDWLRPPSRLGGFSSAKVPTPPAGRAAACRTAVSLQPVAATLGVLAALLSDHALASGMLLPSAPPPRTQQSGVSLTSLRCVYVLARAAAGRRAGTTGAGQQLAFRACNAAGPCVEFCFRRSASMILTRALRRRQRSSCRHGCTYRCERGLLSQCKHCNRAAFCATRPAMHSHWLQRACTQTAPARDNTC
jgi:hypothetical protein